MLFERGFGSNFDSANMVPNCTMSTFPDRTIKIIETLRFINLRFIDTELSASAPTRLFASSHQPLNVDLLVLEPFSSLPKLLTSVERVLDLLPRSLAHSFLEVLDAFRRDIVVDNCLYQICRI